MESRKQNRLDSFDYSSNAAYFITICTKNRRNLFWNAVGASIARPPERLSSYGRTVDDAIRVIPIHYPTVVLEKYVVMPNHVHLLLRISSDSGQPSPTISTVIQQMKGYVTKKSGADIWQKSFHDHVVRNESDYLEIWEYIENNPQKWALDCFYNE